MEYNLTPTTSSIITRAMQDIAPEQKHCSGAKYYESCQLQQNCSRKEYKYSSGATFMIHVIHLG